MMKLAPELDLPHPAEWAPQRVLLHLESNFEQTALGILFHADHGDERGLALLPLVATLCTQRQWDEGYEEYAFTARLVSLLDSKHSWDAVKADVRLQLLRRSLVLQGVSDPSQLLNEVLTWLDTERVSIAEVGPLLLRAVATLNAQGAGAEGDWGQIRDAIARHAASAEDTIRFDLTLERATIELTRLARRDDSVETLVSLLRESPERFSDVTRAFESEPEFLVEIYREFLNREPDVLRRLGARRALMDIERNFGADEPSFLSRTETTSGGAVEPPRYPTSALFFEGNQLHEHRPPPAADAGAPTQLGNGRFPADADLEYRFWIDERPGQGATEANQLGLRPPTGCEFPLQLRVNVWSDDVKFANTHADIELKDTGNSQVASFRFGLRPGNDDMAEVLTFVAHGERVLAVYRVIFKFDGGGVNRSIYLASSHQTPLFIATDWFVFPSGRTATPTITLYIREHRSRLQIFAWNPDSIWSQIGASAEEFARRAGHVYLEFQRVALEHERAQRDRATGRPQVREVDVVARRRRFAQFGQDLLSTFVSPSADESARSIELVLREAADGTEVTVLIDSSAAQLSVPWGIVTHQSARNSRYEHFWASRFALYVQPPWYRPRRDQRQPGAAIQLATAYAERPECTLLAKQLDELGFNLIPLEPSRDKPLAQLGEKHFDIVHFFCHASATPEPDDSTRSLIQALLDPAEQLEQKLKWRVLQPELTSYLNWGQRILLLSDLRFDGPRRFAGAPIVILTACESGVPFAGSLELVEYFLDAGASAVVATEGPVPWKASSTFSCALLEALQRGEPVARAALGARNALREDAELFGLAYSVFGNGQAVIETAPEETGP